MTFITLSTLFAEIETNKSTQYILWYCNCNLALIVFTFLRYWSVHMYTVCLFFSLKLQYSHPHNLDFYNLGKTPLRGCIDFFNTYTNLKRNINSWYWYMYLKKWNLIYNTIGRRKFENTVTKQKVTKHKDYMTPAAM